MRTSFERFTIAMTRAQALAASHPGPCDYEVAELVKNRAIARQLDRIGPDAIRNELYEYGAWSPEQLAQDDENRARIVWIAAGNIREATR